MIHRYAILLSDHAWRLTTGKLDPLRASKTIMAVLRAVVLFVINACLVWLPGETVTVRGPLTTLLRIPGQLPDRPGRISAIVEVPAGAPADLGVGAWLADDEGVWYQRLRQEPLRPGRTPVEFTIEGRERLQAEGHGAAWNPLFADLVRCAGLLFWTTSDTPILITADALRIEAGPAGCASAGQAILRDVRLDSLATRAGARWCLTCLPDPLPENPYDPDTFSLSAVFTHANGTQERVAGFWRQPMRFLDGGDREHEIPDGVGHYALRWRPRLPGRWTVRLSAAWSDGRKQDQDLPPLLVDGVAWDDFVRVDAADRRFFSTSRGSGTTLPYWPIGLNLRSVNDPRGKDRTGSRMTPDRGLASYEAYLRRLAAAGGNAAEIWMSSWNLALEWRDDWPGFAGVGRYHAGNAERLDRILDLAWSLGLRINLVIDNHGKASYKCDPEWPDNPYNARIRPGQNGITLQPGPLDAASQLFEHPLALAGQDRLRRYLIARYADHPAILGWKLWTEMNLTAGGPRLLAWHQQAAKRWRELDLYQHPLTSHWSGNFHTPDRSIVADAALDYVCIDAYHGRGRGGEGELINRLIWDGVLHPSTGLATFGKPVLVTEFGGNWDACPIQQLVAEHRSGPWAALVSGNAGSPMLWWFEWVDQNNQWHPYRAVSRFLTGEDLRSKDKDAARAVILGVEGSAAHLWAAAWSRKGRMLGYLVDENWCFDGITERRLDGITVVAGQDVLAGSVHLEWWNADTGERLDTRDWLHPGGKLAFTAPTFQRHIAFKLTRK